MRNMGGWISPLWAFEGEKSICFSGFFKSMNSANRAQLILEPFTSIHSYIPLVIITYAHKSNLRQEGNILSQSLRWSLAQQGSRGSRIWGELSHHTPNPELRGRGDCTQLLGFLSVFYAGPRSSAQGIVPSTIKMDLSISINISKIITLRHTQRHISEIILDFFFSISTNHHTKQVPEKLMSWASLSVYLQPLTGNPPLGSLEFS